MSETTTVDSPGAQFRSLLRSLEGKWEGITKTWFEPGKLADESPISATFQPQLDNRFSLMEYHGTICGDPLHGKLTVGYYNMRERAEVAWIDSFHMGFGILFSTGEISPDGFSVVGHYPAGEGPDWGWRTQMIVQDTDHVTLRSFNIMPDHPEALAIETVLTRK